MTDHSKARPDYHGLMMNIDAPPASMIVGNVSSYSQGHRDARHAAAEIALEADSKIAALVAEVETLRADPVSDESKLLPRSNGDGGWTLCMDFLGEIDRKVIAEGWDGCTAEVTEIIALEVERYLHANPPPPPTPEGEQP